MLKLLHLLPFLVLSVHGRNIKLINNCGKTIWPGWQAPGDTPNGGGTQLNAGQSYDLQVSDKWTGGRIWARTGCDGNFNCETGFCGNSLHCDGKWGQTGVTLAEVSLTQWTGMDFYDVSLVDGFNVKIQMKAVGGSGTCQEVGRVDGNLLGDCPSELRKYANGQVVQCDSACTKFGNPEYCCTGAHSTAQTCGPTNYSRFFKQHCPSCYSYAYDDSTSTFACKNANYEVIFC